MTNLVQFPGLGLSFTINRVAFSIGDFAIYWYGILIGTGMLLAMLYAFRMAPRLGINVDRMIDVIFIGAVMAVICARAYYVVFAPFKYTSFAQMLDIRDGGLAIYGGVLGAFIFGGLASKWRKVPILPMFDITAIGFFIGQAMGRWGNFVNQEAFGTNTTLPWGMKPNRLHSGAVKFVSAKGQFEALRFIEPLLTDEERDMVRRGHNASKASVAKNASPEEYRASTGFECLLGYLYLSKRTARIEELFDAIWVQFSAQWAC